MKGKRTPTSRLPTSLTAKQRAFVDEYLIDLNATRAAERAGYKPGFANKQAGQLLKHPAVRSAIDAAIAIRGQQRSATAEQVIDRLVRIAMVDPRKLFDAEGKMLPVHKLDDDTALALSALEFDATGARKAKFWDKARALELLGKHLGLFTEKVEVKHTGQVHVYLPSNGR